MLKKNFSATESEASPFRIHNSGPPKMAVAIFSSSVPDQTEAEPIPNASHMDVRPIEPRERRTSITDWNAMVNAGSNRQPTSVETWFAKSILLHLTAPQPAPLRRIVGPHGHI
jgi:hypothetical protein